MERPNGAVHTSQHKHMPQFELIETLMHGLLITELSFDFVNTYQNPEPVFGSELRRQTNAAIAEEARQTMKEFNHIAWYIGGIPVRMQHQIPGLSDGRITHIENYVAGAWVLNLRQYSHGEAREVRGDSQELRSWYHAAVLPDRASAEEIA